MNILNLIDDLVVTVDYYFKEKKKIKKDENQEL